MEDSFARLRVPEKVSGVKPEVLRKLREIDGQIVGLPATGYLQFHTKNDFATICPLRGPQDEGLFFTVPLSWLEGLEDDEVQRIGQRLSHTFWERREYLE